jgi:[CysO sulfur-carrier protein]-S-L-cysteine hydrolase
MKRLNQPLVLPRDTHRRMLDHAREALPMEAVGILGGHPNGRVFQAIPLPNLAGPRAFLADPRSQYEAERRLRRLGLALLAIYHSHPGGGAQLSPADRAFATHLPVVHVVIALARTWRPREQIRAYRIREGVALEVGLCVQ